MEVKRKERRFGIEDLFETKYKGGWIGKRIYDDRSISCKAELVVRMEDRKYLKLIEEMRAAEPIDPDLKWERTPIPYELFSRAFNAGFLEYMGKRYDKKDGCMIEYWRVR